MLPPHPLWGSILDDVDFDFLNLGATLHIHWTYSDEDPPSRHILQFLSVSDFRWFNSIPGPWNYAEITQTDSKRISSEEIHVEIMLWSEEAGLSITAEKVIFDGEDGERFLADREFAWSRYPPGS
jgi:hypothetical protein